MNVTNKSNTAYTRRLNVLAVDDSAKTLTCLFAGAFSGQYSVSIAHRRLGLLDTSALSLDVGSTVTSYWPKTGSIYGGTLLTIRGTRFGTVPTDNPVRLVATNTGATESVQCLVVSTTADTIKCRTAPIPQKKAAGAKATMIVFLRTSEEAACSPKSACTWTYTATLPSVARMTAEFDGSKYEWTVKAAGTGFTGDTSNVELLIGGVTQRTRTISATSAVFVIADVADVRLPKMQLYFDVGLPEGHQGVASTTLTLTPKFVQVSPGAGSVGGARLMARVPGLGNASKGVDIVEAATGNSICRSVRMTAYGKLECITKAKVIPTGTQLALKHGGQTYACAHADRSQCQYQQLAGAGYPSVTAVTKPGAAKLVFTGTGLSLKGFTAHAAFAGVPADTVAVDSAAQVTATWTKGVPPSQNATRPELYFEATSSDERRYAAVAAAQPLTNLLAVSQTPATISCSFAGGCLYSVSAPGLASLLKNDSAQNQINICGSKCIYSDKLSDSAVAKCHVPKLGTAYSNS